MVVDPKPRKGFTSKAVDWLEKVLMNVMYDSSQPHYWLFGNFAPVDETPPCKDLDVIGHLPVSFCCVFMVMLNVYVLWFS